MTSDMRAYGNNDLNQGFFINTGRGKYNEEVRRNNSSHTNSLKGTKITGRNDRAGTAQRGATTTMPSQNRIVENSYVNNGNKNCVAAGKAVKSDEEYTLFYCFVHGFLYPALKNAKVTIKELWADSLKRTMADKKCKCAAGERRADFSFSFIFYLVVFSFLLIFLALSYGKVNEYTGEINALKNSIDEYNTKSAMLEIQIDSRDDLQFIEHEAVTRLGMIKEENVQKKYINLERSDMIEVIPDSKKQTNVSVVMSGAAELLADLFR